jgi:acyl carrier protein
MRDVEAPGRTADDKHTSEDRGMDTTATSLEEVKTLLAEVLGLGDRATTLTPSTGLLGALPELDSLAVVELVAALDERFGISMDEADVTADTFETVGTLAAFVDENRTR